MATYNTVKLKTYQDNPVNLELIAGAAISPGMLVEMASTGKVQAHSTAGGNIVPVMFALEDELQGNDLSDDYAADDPVQCFVPQRGDEVLAILADDQDVTKGDLLESDGNGYLQKHVADAVDSSAATASVLPNQIVGMILETLDLSSSSAAESSGITGNIAVKVRIV